MFLLSVLLLLKEIVIVSVHEFEVEQPSSNTVTVKIMDGGMRSFQYCVQNDTMISVYIENGDRFLYYRNVNIFEYVMWLCTILLVKQI